MTRWLAGVFDPSDRADCSRLAGALAPHAATVLALGPLRIAHSGPASDTRLPLCLLDGFLDNASELRAALELPPRMRGDFALLIWDHEHAEGLLARDQLGVRSLFLHDAGGGLCFASEIRHLLALLPRRPAPDPVGVAHWLTMGQRPGSATLYAGIRRLNPGALLQLDIGAHLALLVAAGELEHLIVERVEACERHELEFVAHRAQLALKFRDLRIRELLLPIEGG